MSLVEKSVDGRNFIVLLVYACYYRRNLDGLAFILWPWIEGRDMIKKVKIYQCAAIYCNGQSCTLDWMLKKNWNFEGTQGYLEKTIGAIYPDSYPFKLTIWDTLYFVQDSSANYVIISRNAMVISENPSQVIKDKSLKITKRTKTPLSMSVFKMLLVHSFYVWNRANFVLLS